MGNASRGPVEVFEDFDYDTIGTAAGDGIRWVNSSDGGDTAFAQNAGIEGGEGTARGATAATNNNLIELAHNSLMWLPSNDCFMEVCLQLDVVTNVALNVGFNDDALEDSNTLPVELSTTTFTSNATTFAGFVYDVNATNDDFHLFWVDDDTDTTSAIADLRFNGAAPVAGRYSMFQVQLYRGSSATALCTGEFTVWPDDLSPRHFQKRSGLGGLQSTVVDGDAALTPYVGVEARSASAHQCDIDYILVRQNRRGQEA